MSEKTLALCEADVSNLIYAVQAENPAAWAIKKVTNFSDAKQYTLEFMGGLLSIQLSARFHPAPGFAQVQMCWRYGDLDALDNSGRRILPHVAITSLTPAGTESRGPRISEWTPQEFHDNFVRVATQCAPARAASLQGTAVICGTCPYQLSCATEKH